MINEKQPALERIEGMIEEYGEGLRGDALKAARDFKTSWLALAKKLYQIRNSRAFISWGYKNFEDYTAKEMFIKKQTAAKLVMSYHFLEKEKPALVSDEFIESATVSKAPSFDAVNILRSARKKEGLSESDYEAIKDRVFEQGDDAKSVRKEITTMIKQRLQQDPEEARAKERGAKLKRFVAALKTLRRDMELLDIVPAHLRDQAEGLIRRIEEEVEKINAQAQTHTEQEE